MHCAIGVNERESERPGSLYNTLLSLGPDGLLARAPQADADAARAAVPRRRRRATTSAPVDTPVGRIGGLICWENRMPLARWAVYQGGPQIWVAPTADDSDGWLATHAAHRDRVGRVRRLGAAVHPGVAFPADFPVPLPEGKEVFGSGGAAIFEPGSGK